MRDGEANIPLAAANAQPIYAMPTRPVTKVWWAVIRLAPLCSPIENTMKLLNTYDDHDEAKEAAEKLAGDKRLASERDATVVIYNLFGIPSWGNFHRLGMYNLGELKLLLDRRATWQPADQARHAEIITTLKTVAKNYGIEVPGHWL